MKITSADVEYLILSYSKLYPKKSYAFTAKSFSEMGFKITPGQVRGVYKKHNLNKSFDRILALKNESEALGNPVPADLQRRLLKERRKHGLEPIKIYRAHQVVAQCISCLRLKTNDMIYINYFFDPYSNTSCVQAIVQRGSTRIMSALDRYLEFVKREKYGLPEYVVTSTSTLVAGNINNHFRLRLERDDINQLVASSNTIPLLKLATEYAAEFTAVLHQTIDEVSALASFEISQGDYDLNETTFFLESMADELNEKWALKTKLAEICGGLLIDDK